MLLSLVWREFLIYFSISYKLEFDAILLVEIITHLLSAHMKSAQTLDLMLLRAQLMLVTWDAESLMNLLPSSLFIGTITCLYKGPFVVMLSLGLGLLFESLMTFWIELIFLFGRLRNTSLIFSIFIAMLEDDALNFSLDVKAWVYNLFMVGFSIFLKYFKISLTSLDNLARIEGKITNTNVGLTTSLPLFDVGWIFLTWGENLDLTLLLKVVLLLLTYRVSQWELYTIEMNFQIALPMPFRFLTSLALLLLIDLPAMYFCILVSNSLMLRALEAKCFIELYSKTTQKCPSQDSGSRAWSGL